MKCIEGRIGAVEMKLSPTHTGRSLEILSRRLVAFPGTIGSGRPDDEPDAYLVDGQAVSGANMWKAARRSTTASVPRPPVVARFIAADPLGGPRLAEVRHEALLHRLRADVLELQRNSTVHGSSRTAETSRHVPAKKNRRGRRNREAGLDCTGQMLTVLREDSRAAVFAGRAWEERLKERFGEEQGFCRRTIERQPLYKKQLRPAVEAAVIAYGPTFEADFLEHGLELWSHKPGRGDKRKDHTEKQALAGRVFMASLENATIDAER
jgi:hypothetical protein